MNRPGWKWDEVAAATADDAEARDWLTRFGERTSGRSWYAGATRIRYPTKAQLRDQGPQCILEGWTPPQPLIKPGDRVLALGSCFAANFIEWLAKNGYEQPSPDPLLVLFRNPFENVAVIAQQLRWAFGEIDPDNLFWTAKDKARMFATEDKRLAMQAALLRADVFIATLSMSETWYDKVSGEPLWRIMSTEEHQTDRHDFKVLSFSDTMKAFEDIERIRRTHLPNLKILYTVSPLPFDSTYRSISAVTANTASKAVVRAALDEFLRARPDDVNATYFYFPGYEIINALLGDPFEADNRHLHHYLVNFVMSVFVSAYTAHPSGVAVETIAWPEAHDGGQLMIDLERQIEETTTICDQRMAVIRTLQHTCEERLGLIQTLQQACDERGAALETSAATVIDQAQTIDRLQATCAERDALIARLNGICDERSRLIDDLKRTCDERLALIDRLDAAVKGAS